MRPPLSFRGALAATLAALTPIGVGAAHAQTSTSTGPTPLPVLLVIANQDFYEPDFTPLRLALEREGIPVEVGAATTARPCVAHGGVSIAAADLSLDSARAEDYSAIVFVGGWGASSYQYAFEGTYHNTAYRPDPAIARATNDLINDFIDQDRPVAAICHGVSVLAWARVDGVSPLAGREVTAYAGGGPGFEMSGRRYADGAIPTRWHVESNGAFMHRSGAVGSPTTTADDVIVDGPIITGEDWNAAPALAATLADEVRAREIALEPAPSAPAAAPPSPVLMVIANQDFFYREYAEPRAELERAGIRVEVAAATRATAFPHTGSGQGSASGAVTPDLTIIEALDRMQSDPDNYSAIVFVGGWGASQYQYAFEGTYANAAYNGDFATRRAVNDLVNDFLAEDKYVTAICHGVSVLAWARVDGVSPLAGRTVTAWPFAAPSATASSPSVFVGSTTRWHVEANGASMVAMGSIGDPTTSADDVIVDGRIITAESFESATAFGATLAARLVAR